MRRTLRQNAVALAVVGFAFCLFFTATKHLAPYSAINPFAEDPYDSVGSFAVQFLLLMMLVSLSRAFQRRRLDSGAAVTQVRGQLMAYLAIAFTMIADLIALLRHPSEWIASRGGYQLLALTACLLLWSIAAAVLLLFTTRALTLPRSTSRMKIIVVPAAIVLLVVYPERLRHNLPGEIFTVLFGMALLFVVVWALGTAFIPRVLSSDKFDLAAMGKPRDRGRAGSLAYWLRSSCARWTLVILLGVLCGAFLVFQELADGPSPHGARRLLVIAVYLGLETAGVLTGYALLAKPLRLLSDE